MLSLYLPGSSPVHRAPAGLKLAVLAALGVGLFVVSRVAVVAAALAAVLAVGLLAARLPVRALWGQVRPVWIWLAALFVVHLLVTGPLTGTVAVLRLLTLVLAAAVVTSTTRVTALVAVVEWLAGPLRVVGVRPARVGLVIAMTLRFIPLLADRAARIREAQAARGAERVRLGLLVPLIISVLQLAHTLSEALDARGADDTPVRPLRAAGSAGAA
jgi:biotin transport system permease protein